MTSEVNSAFDYNKYMVGTNVRTETVKIEGTDEEFTVKVKPLSWSKKNQLVSRYVKWSEEGVSSFNGDGYVRECLKEIIVEAPWGKTSEAFLISIDNRLGTALEQLVPSAFDNESIPEDKKKESNGI
jgi:hypothetical protein